MHAIAAPTPYGRLYTIDQLGVGLRLDDAAKSIESDYILELLDAATEYAETALSSTLLSRTVTATFFCGDKLALPRGPVASLISCRDAGGTMVAAVQGYGTMDLLALPGGFTPPLTAVYVAGYGSNAAAVPADIRIAIRAHVATLYSRRASVSEKDLSAVPHSLEDFYRQKCRYSGVG